MIYWSPSAPKTNTRPKNYNTEVDDLRVMETK